MEAQSNRAENDEQQWLTEMATCIAGGAQSRKSIDLISRRQLPKMLHATGLSCDSARAMLLRLIQLQDAIYALDRYGEAVWNLECRVLETIWRNILAQLSLFGLAGNDRIRHCEELFQYQEIEIGRRKFSEPTEVEIGHFYRLKTCDVRLSRKLLGVLGAPLRGELLPIWDAYDIVAEIKDDLEDLEEDCFTFNANRFLISLRLYPESLVRAEYSDFVNALLMQSLPEVRNEEMARLKMMFVAQAHSVLRLLKPRPSSAYSNRS